jgi:RND family efflux transporter MFP subunit
VIVDLPTVKQITDYEEFTGRTEAFAAVDVKARITGHLLKVHFKEGDEVKEGDKLFDIDPKTFVADLERARASVLQNQSRLERLKKDYDRSRDLFDRRAIGQEEADRIGSDFREAEAALAVAKAGQMLAETNYGYTQVTAPLGGRISRKYVDPGNLVRADDTTLTSIVALDTIFAYFDIPERILLHLQRSGDAATSPLPSTGSPSPGHPSPGTPPISQLKLLGESVQIGLADEEGYSLSGTIDFVDNKVDPSTGTLRARANIPNRERILYPGLFVRVRLPVSPPHPATLIPEEALGSDQGKKFVFVLNAKDEVVYRPVTTGQRVDGLRVVKGEREELSPKDRVIVTGQQRVRAGVKVEPKPAEHPAGAAAKAATPPAPRPPAGHT